MKKALSVLLSVLLALMSFPLFITVYAQDAPTVTVSEQTAKGGDTLDITVTLTDSPEIASLKFTVDFDSDLTLNSVTYGGALTGMAQQPETLSCPVILNWVTLEPISGDILFATLSFTVDEYAMPGSKNITVTYDPEDVCNIEEENVYFDVINGGISVTCDHESTSNVEAVDSTCCTPGHAAYTYCIICDEVLAGSSEPLPLDPDNHEGGTGLMNQKTATCAEAGYTGDTYCFGCGAVIQKGETIPVFAHTVGDWLFDAENHWHHCTVCGQNVDVAAHSGGTANCHTKAACEVCGAEYGEYDLNNHNGETEIRNAKAATCAEAGYTGDTYCLGCGAKIADGETIPVLAHTVGDWLFDAENHWHHCTACGQNVDVAAHSGGTANCHTKAVCEVCGAEYGEYYLNNHDGETELRNERPISMTQTGYTGDLCCVGCGAVLEPGEEFFLLGDANLDGELNIIDLIRLKKYLIDSSVEISIFADISGNGIILPNDLEYMRALILGSEYTVEEP